MPVHLNGAHIPFHGGYIPEQPSYPGLTWEDGRDAYASEKMELAAYCHRRKRNEENLFESTPPIFLLICAPAK